MPSWQESSAKRETSGSVGKRETGNNLVSRTQFIELRVVGDKKPASRLFASVHTTFHMKKKTGKGKKNSPRHRRSSAGRTPPDLPPRLTRCSPGRTSRTCCQGGAEILSRTSGRGFSSKSWRRRLRHLTCASCACACGSGGARACCTSCASSSSSRRSCSSSSPPSGTSCRPILRTSSQPRQSGPLSIADPRGWRCYRGYQLTHVVFSGSLSDPGHTLQEGNVSTKISR